MKKDNNLKEDLELLIIDPKENKKPRKSKRIKKSEMSADALDDSFVEPESKKGIIIGTLVSIFVIGAVILFVNYISGEGKILEPIDKKEEPNSVITNKEEVDNTDSVEQSGVGEYKEEFGSLFLYKTSDEKIIAKREVISDLEKYTYLGIYNCQSDKCDLPKIEGSEFVSFENTTTLLNDDGLFIYNYNTDTVLTYKYDSFRKIKALDKEYLIGVAEDSTNIYSAKGNKITTDGYEQIGFIYNDLVHSYNDNVISAKKNGKWGLITIRTNETIIDFAWDNLYVSNDELYIVEKEGEYLVMDSSNVQLTENSYPLIVEAYSEFFITIEDNKLDIKKYDGESLLIEPLDVLMSYERYNDKSGVKLQKTSIMDLEIVLTNTDGTVITYVFNTANYTLEQK